MMGELREVAALGIDRHFVNFYLYVGALPALFVLYGAWKLAGMASTVAGKAAIVATIGLLYVVLLVGDEIWYRYRVEQLCAQDGGLRRYSVAENVRGFYDVRGLFPVQNVVKLGFEYVEGPSFKTGRRILSLFRLDEQGNETVSAISAPSARYELGYSKTQPALHVVREQEYIRDRQTDSMLSEHVTYTTLGGWIMRFLSQGVSYQGYSCPSRERERFSITAFLTDTLKPPKR